VLLLSVSYLQTWPRKSVPQVLTFANVKGVSECSGDIFLARRTDVNNSLPRARLAAIAAASVQPVPWVFVVSTRAVVGFQVVTIKPNIDTAQIARHSSPFD